MSATQSWLGPSNVTVVARLGQIGSLIAICRRDKTAAPPRIERVLAHQPADLLGVHHKATMTKLSINTPIAISFELVANRLHLRNDGRIVRACVGPIVKS